MTQHVVIVGGGISGLSALEHITRVAPKVRVTLLEKSSHLGGHIRTEHRDGFVMEAGPDVILTSKPAAVELAKRVGIGDRLQGIDPSAKGSFILSGGRLRRVPAGLTGLVPSKLAPFVVTDLLSTLGKLRVGLELFVPPRRDGSDESIEAFVTRRLGREMYERLAEPLLSGISAGDGSRLSIAAMFPQLCALERDHGGLLRGMIAKRRTENRSVSRAPRSTRSNAAAGFASFPGGLEQLVRAVVQSVARRAHATGKIALRTRAGVLGIDAAEDSADAQFVLTLSDGERLDADAVIMATPAYASSAMLTTLAPELARRLAAVEYASTTTISLAYPSTAVRRPLDATGYVVPRREGHAVLACTWTSAKFAGRAPAGQALFRLFVGGAGRHGVESLSDDALLVLAAAEMRAIMGITVRPSLYSINRFDRALPQYTVGHLDRMKAIAAEAARIPGLELAGAVYRGVGIPDCVQSGVDAASRALAAVRARPPLITSLS